MPRPKPGLKHFLRDVETARQQRGRNTLAAWLRTHHDALLAELDGKPIDWELYLAAFAKRGLKDADGNAPSKATASKTWHRVRATVAAERARKQAHSPATPVLAPGEIAAGVHSLEPAQTTTAPDRPRIQLDIRPARPLVQPSDSPPPPTPTQTQSGMAANRDDAEAQIRRALDALEAGRTPMPRLVR